MVQNADRGEKVADNDHDGEYKTVANNGRQTYRDVVCEFQCGECH